VSLLDHCDSGLISDLVLWTGWRRRARLLWVLVPGTSQRRIARSLNAAYANGLLSEDTFLRRIDQLLEGGVIDPARLVGDLNLRGTYGVRLPDVAAAFTRGIARITKSSDAGRRRSRTLLALDWSGARSEMLIGRHHRCDVVLSDLTVSRRALSAAQM
jgi:DNA-binding Lrp family transcriptional regulator